MEQFATTAPLTPGAISRVIDHFWTGSHLTGVRIARTPQGHNFMGSKRMY